MTSDTSKTNVATTFGYDAVERQTTVTDPRTGAVTTAYHATTGQVTSVTDAASNATSFTYDSAGRKATETNDLGDVTRFSYNDRDQVTRTWGDVPYPTEYVYDDYGLLEEMRTWRSAAAWTGGTWPTGVSGSEDITTWGYQEATGLLTSKTDDDSESTDYTYTTGRKLYTRTWARGPSTTYGYDSATGELLTVNYSDSTPDVTFTYDRLGRISTVADGFGSRTLTYNAALQPETEVMTGVYNKTVTQTYATSGVIGRPTGVNTGADYTASYAYDSKGRYNGTSWTANSQSGSASYTFVSNSDLVDVLTMGSVTADYAYEANRNLRTQVLNKYSTTTLSQYDYVYDDVGRRTSVKNSGTAFAAAAFNLYGYNDRSELTGSNRYLGTNLATLTSPVAGETRAYTYDPIGNRTAYTVGANNGTYSPNNLNQYGSESVAGGGSNTFTHDDDGNLTAISGNKNVTYTYNAENQLITAAPTTPVTNDKKVESTYDYMGRRVQKVISNYNGSSWVTSSTKKFVYNGWNVLEEQTVSGTSKYYIWGLDLSQSLQGAGGVGGLLAKIEGTPTHNYVYDGNGNVGQLIDASDGSIDAHYEYDPYGNSIVASGAQAAGNTYRFSTKYLDTDYGLYYYGYRFYDSLTGRWVSRDPLEEDGGINIYAFIANNPIDTFDMLGLFKVRIDADAYIPFQWIPGPLFGTELGGDGREESDVPGKSSRIANWIVVELDNGEEHGDPKISSGSSISPSKLRGFGRMTTATGEHSSIESAKRIGPCQVEVRLQHSGHVPWIPLAPSIDYDYTFILSRRGDHEFKVEYKGRRDGFPAYEVYIENQLFDSHDPRILQENFSSLYGKGEHTPSFTVTLKDK